MRKAVECFIWNLMGHPRRSIEDSGAESDVNFGGQAQEVSQEKNKY